MRIVIQGVDRRQHPGAQDSVLLDPSSALELGVEQLIDLGEPTRDDRSEDFELSEELLANSICEVEDEDGIVQWVRGTQLKDMPEFEVVRQRDDGTLRLTPSGEAMRGRTIRRLRSLRIFRRPAAEAGSKLIKGALVRKIESTHGHEHGLYRVVKGPAPAFEPFDSARAGSAGDKLWLVMLHGTFSSTAGSFGDLWDEDGGARFLKLYQHYKDGGNSRILALEHASMSADPVDNALDLVDGLPPGARLHLLSHSRGGLVGELLVRRGTGGRYFSQADLDRLESALGGERYIDKVRELDQRLRDKRIVVERFVRVACPARGTNLASGRLERWLTVLLNLVRLGARGVSAASGMTLHPVLGMGSDLIKGLLLDLVNLDDLPGLKAMDPGDPLLRALLNACDEPVDTQLAVVAGITRGSGVVNRLRQLLARAYFRNDNDLVVDTPSMFGGYMRAEHNSIRWVQDDSSITHLNYFRQAATASRIMDGLTAPDWPVPGFEPFEVDQSKLRSAVVPARPHLRSLDSHPPVCVVLPGIMGSYLDVGGSRVWTNYRRLINGRFRDLRIDTEEVEAVGIDGKTYGALVNFLSETHETIPFPYDWRLPIEASGRLLNDQLHEILNRIDRDKQPVRIVAHSMGGLVARSMMMESNSAWERMLEHPQSRLVMMGTPSAGSHAITLLLTGRERLLRLLAVADFRHRESDLVAVAAGFGGALDMLPARTAEDDDRDYFDSTVWDLICGQLDSRTTTWPRLDRAELERARQWRSRLEAQQLDPTRVFYVAGVHNKTPERLELPTRGLRSIRFRYSRHGDGRVLWYGGIPEGLVHGYVQAKHGSIPGHTPSHAAYLDLLEQGKADRLESNGLRLLRSDDGEELFDPYHDAEHDEEPAYLPSAEDLMTAAIGGEPEPEPVHQSPPMPVQVQVVWGNVKYSAYPVIVGHYKGDAIVSAEAALNHMFDGELERRHALGLYPGAVGSSLIIRRPGNNPPGVIVVGLGSIGSLGRGQLAASVREGVLQWAVETLSDHRQRRSHSELSRLDQEEVLAAADRGTGLALLLVGSGPGGLSLRDAAHSLLAGVAQALNRLGPEETARLNLQTIQFIEIFEDSAHSFWHELNGLLGGERHHDPVLERFELTPRLIEGEQRRRRLVIQSAPGWWEPLRITCDEDRLIFESISDHARSERRGVGAELHQIENLVQQGVKSARRDPALEIALFEMLVPNDLKMAAPRRDNMRLLLDHHTAWIPWELMTDRDSASRSDRCGLDSDACPQSVQTGMIRQLLFSDAPAPKQRVTEGRCVLVIGDPKSRLDELPAAQQEARLVSQWLSANDFDCGQPLICSNSTDILKALFRCSYRIVHFAGHGVRDADHWMAVWRARLANKQEPAVPDSDQREEAMTSGFIIGEADTLTWKHIAQLREVPELVFLNCCHLGSIASKRVSTRMAADFGEQFIQQGVRAVIAAGWAVEDRAALHFAEVFYHEMFNGQCFGDAVRQARQANFRKFSGSNTWAAYQCYGDPSYRLNPNARPARARRRSDRQFASKRQFIHEAVETAGSLDQLAGLEQQAIQIWGQQGELHDSELLYHLADCYRKHENLSRAVELFALAMSSHDNGDLPMRAAEQYVNLECRLAASQTKATITQRRTRIRQARTRLETLISLADSPERQELLGSTYKLEAMLGGNALTVRRALVKGAEAYQRQGQLVLEGRGSQPAGPGARACGPLHAATLFASGWWLNGDAEDRDKARQQLELVPVQAVGVNGAASFWDRIVPADRALAQAFVRGRMSSRQAAELSRQYVAAARMANDRDALDAVTETLAYLQGIIAAVRPEKHTESDVQGLKSLAERLEAIKKSLSNSSPPS